MRCCYSQIIRSFQQEAHPLISNGERLNFQVISSPKWWEKCTARHWVYMSLSSLTWTSHIFLVESSTPSHSVSVMSLYQDFPPPPPPLPNLQESRCQVCQQQSTSLSLILQRNLSLIIAILAIIVVIFLFVIVITYLLGRR